MLLRLKDRNVIPVLLETVTVGIFSKPIIETDPGKPPLPPAPPSPDHRTDIHIQTLSIEIKLG